MRLIVGAKGNTYPGWISTDARSTSAPLDIRDAFSWARCFWPDSIDRICAEHVIEHLEPREAYAALLNFRAFLRPGGFARIAVPDAFYPNEAYQGWCAPGGWGRALIDLFQEPPGHIAHYNYRSLIELISAAGLTPRLCEWHDERGRFHHEGYDVDAAPIKRRAGSTHALNFYRPVLGFDNISLIVDAVKPLAVRNK